MYNAEVENRLSPGLQPLKTGSVLKIQLDSVIVFSISEIILLSSKKYSIHASNVLE